MGKENICDDIAIVDLMQAVKPMIKVSRCELESNCDVVEAVCNDSRYFAEDKNISSQVSLVWGRSGALKSCPCGLCELSMSNKGNALANVCLKMILVGSKVYYYYFKKQSLLFGEFEIWLDSDVNASSMKSGSHLKDEDHLRTSDGLGRGIMDLTYL